MTFIAFTGKIYNPDLKFSAAGKSYFRCSVKEEHRDKNRDSGQYEKCGVTWHRVTYFGNRMFTAEELAEIATEGATAVIYGESKKKEYQKKDGGQGESDEIIPEPGAFGVAAVAPEFRPDGRQGQAQQPAGAAQQPSQGQWPQQGGQWNQPSWPQQGQQPTY